MTDKLEQIPQWAAMGMAIVLATLLQFGLGLMTGKNADLEKVTQELKIQITTFAAEQRSQREFLDYKIISLQHQLTELTGQINTRLTRIEDHQKRIEDNQKRIEDTQRPGERNSVKP